MMETNQFNRISIILLSLFSAIFICLVLVTHHPLSPGFNVNTFYNHIPIYILIVLSTFIIHPTMKTLVVEHILSGCNNRNEINIKQQTIFLG